MDKMVVYEDDILMIVHKPAGIATQTSHIGQADVVSELKNYRKNKGEDTYIGVIHRLDQPVEGLLVFAKTPKAAAALSAQLKDGALKKSYIALIYGELQKDAGGELKNFLLKDSRTNLSRIAAPGTKGAKEAILSWKCREAFKGRGFSTVEVWLYTGRRHQIRAQLSNAGMPLLGDMKYGTNESKELSKKLGVNNTALLAYKLALLHPDDGRSLEYEIDYKTEYLQNILNISN